MDPASLAIGNVALIALIVGLIQFCKSFAPNTNPDIWRALSAVLGLVGQIVVFLIAHGESFAGWGLATWAACIVLGLSAALTAGKAYDETLGKGLSTKQ